MRYIGKIYGCYEITKFIERKNDQDYYEIKCRNCSRLFIRKIVNIRNSYNVSMCVYCNSNKINNIKTNNAIKRGPNILRTQINNIIILDEFKRVNKQWYIKIFCNICKQNKFISIKKIYKKSTYSCGCKRNLNKTTKIGKYFSSYYINTFKRTAKYRELDFDIDLEYLDSLYEKQNGKCYYSGEKLILPDWSYGCKYSQSNHNISIDRIDSKKGYIKGNCVLCTILINKMKWDSTSNEFIDICRNISSYHPIRDASSFPCK